MRKKHLDYTANEFIATMRAVAIDGINNAKQGHIGMALGASEIFYALVGQVMRFSPTDPKWIDRDRLVLSAGHGSMGLYSIYHLLGLLSIDDIKAHKEYNSKTPSHPEIDKLEFVDASTGPLGQGVAMATGMALSAKHLIKRFNKDRLNIFNHNIFVVCGDGDLQEGVALEAIQFAGTNKLSKLVIIHDYNNMQIDSASSEVNNINFELFFKSQNFNVIILRDNDPVEIQKALERIKDTVKPTYIQVPTTIAYGTDVANSPKGHNGILSPEATVSYKKRLGLKETKPFEYNEQAYEFGRQMIISKSTAYTRWVNNFEKLKTRYPKLGRELEALIKREKSFDFKDFKFKQTNVATRNYVAEIMQYLDGNYEDFMGGSADLRSATKVGFDSNRNIKYGIREFAMTAINNGINLHSGYTTFGSTFLVFADYAKPALRLGALMEIPSISVFSHDSYQVGGDGPTHQPVEQIGMLRSIPNYLVFRPADENEMLNSFKYALNSKKTPCAIITCRQEVKSFNLQKNEFKAAYFIDKQESANITLLASGSEVSLAEQVANELKKINIKASVISVPSLQLLLDDEKLISQLELAKQPLFAIEASNDHLWYKLSKYSKFDAHLAKDFGHSAPGQFVYELNGFNKEFLVEKIKLFLEK
ncbi:transketolase-like TK C-terminal-containing protein [Mycoplasma sp. 5370]